MLAMKMEPVEIPWAGGDWGGTGGLCLPYSNNINFLICPNLKTKC